MKKTIFAITALLAGLTSYSAVTVPVVFDENFVEMSQKSDYLTSDWVTYGNGATPTAEMKNFFVNQQGEIVNYILLDYGKQCIPMCCTNFDPSTQADQWMITPQIEINSNNMELGFTVAVFCNYGAWGLGSNTFKILVSDSGTAKEDFKEVVFEGQLSGSSTKEINQRSFFCPLNGFDGKKVHIAFVGTGQDCGMLGFTDITLGNYAITVSNETPEMAQLGEEAVVAYNIGLKTPVACPGVKAVLESTKGNQEVYYKKQFGSSSNTILYQKVEFEPLVLNDAGTVDYTVTLTPDYEGAPASVFTGSIGVPTMSYLKNCVVEEVTATGCQACPAGIAAMEFYEENYKGTETQGKVIGIAIHGYINHTDPMSEGVTEYLTNTMALNGTTVYPQAIYNRSSRGFMPGLVQSDRYVKNEINSKAYTQTEIVKVTAPDPSSDYWGKPVTVDFKVKNAYQAKSLALNACVVLVENNVKGFDANYSQTNGLYNRDKTYFTSNYDPEIYPFAKKFLSGGEMALAEIPYDRMTYHHVARKLYPSFYGSTLSNEWQEDTYQPYSFTFDIPETVLDLKNCKVVVIVTNASNADIVAAEEADVIGSQGGVGDIEAEKELTIVKENNNIVVNAEGDIRMDVYSVDGRKLGSYSGNDQVCVDGSSFSGITVVKVSTPQGCHVGKLIF